MNYAWLSDIDYSLININFVNKWTKTWHPLGKPATATLSSSLFEMFVKFCYYCNFCCLSEW